MYRHLSLMWIYVGLSLPEYWQVVILLIGLVNVSQTISIN